MDLADRLSLPEMTMNTLVVLNQAILLLLNLRNLILPGNLQLQAGEIMICALINQTSSIEQYGSQRVQSNPSLFTVPRV